MLNPATIALLIQGIQAAIAAEPKVVALIKQTKDYIAGLFSAGLISKATQDSIHAHVDEVAKWADSGSGGLPPEWTVEADPA